MRDAVRAGARPFVIVAADASRNTHERLLPLLRARGVEHVVALERETLGRAIGRAPVSALAIGDASLADRVRELLGGASEAGQVTE